MSLRVAVVGGGIAGLTSAYRAHKRGFEVTLFETDPRPGGKIRSSPFAGFQLDEGADAFLARVPWATDLCVELGLGDELVSPSARSALLWSRGRLRPIPQPMVLGVPLDLDELAASGVVSGAAVERARQDLVRTDPDPVTGDESVGALIRRRLGDEVLEQLVDPLLGGINAGDADRLSLAASAPQLATAATTHPSLIQALADLRRDVDPEAPVFYAPRGGIVQIVDALTAELGEVVTTSAPVTNLARADGKYCISGDTFDRVVLALPAFEAAPLLAVMSPRAADLLRSIEFASVAMVSFAFGADHMLDLDASGVLVPKAEGLLMTACSFTSKKWAHIGERHRQTAVLRTSAGSFGNDRAMLLDDDELISTLRAELAMTLGIEAPPLETRVARWRNAFPQYTPGHVARVDAVDAALAVDTPGLVVAGASYHGIGVPACIADANRAIERIA